MQNGKIANRERKLKKMFTIPAYVEQAAKAFLAKAENRDQYRSGGMSQLMTELLKAKLGIE